MKAVVVRHGFGPLKPGVERLVGECRFTLLYDGRVVTYTRSCRGNVLEAIVQGAELEVIPAPPVFAEPRLSNLISIALPKPIILGPGASASIDSCIPIDIVVTAGEVIVDVVPVVRVKYSLYGEPDQGLIARYVKLGECNGPSAALRIHFRNLASRSVVVRRVVFPAFMLDICYSESGVDAGALSVIVTGFDAAAVQPVRVERSGCKPAPKLLKAPVFERQRFVMLYGL